MKLFPKSPVQTLLIALFTGFVLLVYVVPNFVPSQARLSLPDSAKDIEEYRSGVSDYLDVVKASMPERDFFAYAKSLSFEKVYSPQQHSAIQPILDMAFSHTPVWWDPPAADERTFFNYTQGDDNLEYVKYHNGKIYHLKASW
jgi:hypothetical protein